MCLSLFLCLRSSGIVKMVGMGTLPTYTFKDFSPPLVLKELIAWIPMGGIRLSRALLDAKLVNQLDGQPLFLNFQI